MNITTQKLETLYQVLMEKGLHPDLSREIAYKHLNTEYTATRMLGYLYNHTELTEELVVDEMISILEDRERFKKKGEAEQANAAITRYYNEDRD